MQENRSLEYKLVNRIDTTPSGYKKLLDLYLVLKEQENIEVILDFQDLDFIDANICALFHAILFKLNKERNITFSTDIDRIKSDFEVLIRNGFIKLESDVIDDRKSTVPLTVFNCDDSDPFADYVINKLLNHRALKNKKLDVVLADHFFEVFANIQTHARTGYPVFACGQYYPKNHKLIFTLVDLGVGFFEPINQHTNGEISSAETAIEWAIKGNSTKLDAPGGLGLSTIYNYCLANNGEINIITGDAYWGNNLGNMGTRTFPDFCGTTIHLCFDCTV